VFIGFTQTECSVMKMAHILLLLQPVSTELPLVCTEILVPNYFMSVLHKNCYRRAFCRLYFSSYVSYKCLLKRVFKFLILSLIWLAWNWDGLVCQLF